MSTYTVTIPTWHPARLNQLLTTHWAVANRMKSADKEVVAWYMTTVPPATGKRRLLLTIVLGKGQRGGDPDAYYKSLLDALTTCGQLTDDNRQGVELAPVQFVRGATPATIIMLEDL